MILGLTFIGAMIFAPEGILGALRKLFARSSSRQTKS
jgi:ABC-type branched-subunit amino acid transport system permease subunit